MIIVDDTVYTAMEAIAGGQEGKYILITEDAYGETSIKVVEEKDLPGGIDREMIKHFKFQA